MTTNFSEEILNRQKRAEEWISEAEKHIRVARLLLKKKKLQNIVLYHLQQSMEMATKGLARASGISHSELRKEIKHNNLFLFVKIVEIVVDSLDGYEQINEVLACFYQEGKNYDSAKHIQDVLAATASPGNLQTSELKKYARKIFDSGMKMPPEEVKSLVDSFDRAIRLMQVSSQAKNLIRKLLATPIYLQTPAPEVNWMDDIINQVHQQLVGRVGASPNPAAVALVKDLARNIATREEITAELKANNGKFCFDGDQFVKVTIGIPGMLLANLGLLIIGSLVWAHESYPRYPAEPDAPDSIEQAVGERKLGVKHYTNNMGVIRNIKPLTDKAAKTISLLKSANEAGFLLMSAKDAESLRQ